MLILLNLITKKYCCGGRQIIPGQYFLLLNLCFWAFPPVLGATPAVPRHAAGQKIEIIYAGPMGASAVMVFNRQAEHYTALLILKAPLYKMDLKSNGDIKGLELIPVSYEDRRGGDLYAASKFNYAARTVTFGKINEQKQAAFTGTTFDVLSLPWQISFNPDLILEKLVLSNGKKIYPLALVKTPVKRLISTKKINLKGQVLVINSYDFTSAGNLNFPVRFSFAPAYRNLPVVIHYQNNYINTDFTATAITVDDKRIF